MYSKIKTSQGNIFKAPMASGRRSNDLISLCLVNLPPRIASDEV